MIGIRKRNPRGATSALIVVIATVFFLLFALGIWMWVDMSRSDIEGKAKTYAELKTRGYRSEHEETSPAQVPTNEAPGYVTTNVVECRRTKEPIVIDGLRNEAAWGADAQPINSFGQFWLGPNHPAKSKTTARLLWDDEYLYFFAELDDTDIYSDITTHNGDLWNNDVFELFFKPSKTNLGYYEFEVNAQNATLEVYFPSRGSGGLRRWAKKVPFHLETKVVLRDKSTLNDASDRDTGWVIEGRIPWSDFAATGGKPKAGDEWRFTLGRFDFSVNNDDVEMTASAPLTQGNFHHYEDYSILKFK